MIQIAVRTFGQEAVVLTTSNDSFGPTDLNFLENRYYTIALSKPTSFALNAGAICNSAEIKSSSTIPYFSFNFSNTAYLTFRNLFIFYS